MSLDYYSLLSRVSKLKTALLFLIVPLLFLTSCGDGSKNKTKDSFSSPKELFVDYVSSHTSGFVSIKGDIRLKLRKATSDSVVGQVINEKVFSFSPNIEGTTRWLDNRTIVFEPTESLKRNTKYEIKADLSQIISDVDKDRKTFQFVFNTLNQSYSISHEGLKYASEEDPAMMQLEGKILTADYADFENIKKMLSASLGSKDLKIEWKPLEKENNYLFVIPSVQKNAKTSSLKLNCKGSAIGIDNDRTLTVSVPALNDFKVLSTKITNGEQAYISVIFSESLNKRMNLSGLVTLSGTSNPKLVVNLNELKIFPRSLLSGQVTLTIDEGVKNSKGVELPDTYSTELEFRQVKPEVKLLTKGNQSIVPQARGLIVPFEAVGLSSVEVKVVQIFDNNVLQYLQVNPIGGTNQLTRVGRPVTKKTISLNSSGVADLRSWNQFSLKLDDIMDLQPGALYQVEIGFKKKHSLYFCSNEGDEFEVEEEDLEQWDSIEEDSYWDSSEYYYGSGYEWRERDNPCHISYYMTDRKVRKVLLASDLAVVTKHAAGDAVHAFVTDLVDATPQSGVNVEVYNFQQQLIQSAQTDGEGKVSLPVGNQKPFALVAKKGNQVGYVKLDDGSSLSLSNFDVSGTRIQKGIKGFIYGERGVWRPADTVHLSFVLESLERELPENHPVVMELYNPNSQLVERKLQDSKAGNIYRFDFITDEESPTGSWLAKAKVGGASFTKAVKIETIKPNRLRINLEFDKERLEYSDRYASADLDVQWLTGATARNLQAEYEVKFTPLTPKFKKYPNHDFNDESKNFYSQRTLAYSGTLDDNGHDRVTFDLGDVDEVPGALKANFYGRVYEQGGEFSIGNTSIPYYPYESYVGVKVPEGDKRGMLLTDKDHSVQIATVDAQGKPVSKQHLEVKLYKLDWRWWWDTSDDNVSNYVGRSYRDPISTEYVNTTNGEGTYQLRVDYPSWGRYYLQIRDTDSGHSTGKTVYLDWPGWAGKGKRGELGGATMLDFSVEKESYKVGEDIKITIPSTAGNRVLISLETGSKVLQTQWAETDEGTTTVTFEATPDMAPNIYAHLTMIQPYAQTANDLPIRLYGISSIKVVDPSTLLKPVIGLPSSLRPEQEFTLKVSEEKGQAMAYTVAIVDEGLLDITNYKTPKPWSHFFAREALGVKTWDIYDDVLGAFAGKMNRLMAVGGDGEFEADDKKQTNRFKPVVMYLGPFELGAGETQQHRLKLPQYIGSVKTMVVAAKQGAYGNTSVQTPVQQSLMVQATFPRVAGPNETMNLPVNVFSLEEGNKNVNVSVSVKGELQLEGKSQKQVRFTKSGDQIINFKLASGSKVGPAYITVTADDGKVKSSYDIELTVIPRNPETTDVEDKILQAGESITMNYQPMGILGLNSGMVEISTLPSLNLAERMRYLIKYPHGCIEQTTSSVFPQLFLSGLTELSDQQRDEIQRNVNAGINRLKKFQLPSGGFSYWPGRDYPNIWGTNYAGHFLVEAQKAGFSVPSDMINKWAKFQKERAQKWSKGSSDHNDDLSQAYRLFTLALADKTVLGAMNRMKENANISAKAKWRLAAAYANAGYDKFANQLIEGLAVATEDDKYDRYTFGSSLRDQAMILETLTMLDKQSEAFELTRKIATELGTKGKWFSTQTTSYCLMAISKYTKDFSSDASYNISLSQNGKQEELKGQEYIRQSIIKDKDKAVSVEISNQGEAPVFIRLIRSGTPIEGSEESIVRNLKMSVEYIDDKGKTLNVRSIDQGTNFKAIVTVSNPGQKGRYDEMALTQIFPSGWEIINTRLDGSAEQHPIREYMDIRDDRVMQYFDLKPNQKTTFEVSLNAAYAGKYYLPSVACEAMYDNTVFANEPGRWIEVIADK